MRILYLCHRIPYPPNKGDKIRAYHQLTAMGSRHEVDLFTLADHAVDPNHKAALERFCRPVTVIQLDPRWARLRSLPYLLTDKPLTLPYFHSAELHHRVHEALASRSYDRIFLYCSAMAQYVEEVTGIPMVADLVDVDSDKWRQYAAKTSFPFSPIYRREARCLSRYERAVCGFSARVVVSTEREAGLLREIARDAEVTVISNGIDTEYFRPSSYITGTGVPTVSFTGDMSYLPNKDAVLYFAKSVLPILRKSISEVRFLIIGRNPGPEVKKLARLAGVEVTGTVSDIRPYLAQTHVSVAPFSIAAGIQNKILEALASGIPVVASSATARGLTRAVAEAVDVADDADEIAKKVLYLLQHPELAAAKGAEGRRQVSVAYNWDRSMEELMTLVEYAGSTKTSSVPISTLAAVERV